MAMANYWSGGKVMCVPDALPASTLANTPAEGNQRFHLRRVLEEEVVYPPTGSTAYEREMSTSPTLLRSMALLYL